MGTIDLIAKRDALEAEIVEINRRIEAESTTDREQFERLIPQLKELNGQHVVLWTSHETTIAIVKFLIKGNHAYLSTSTALRITKDSKYIGVAIGSLECRNRLVSVRMGGAAQMNEMVDLAKHLLSRPRITVKSVDEVLLIVTNAASEVCTVIAKAYSEKGAGCNNHQQQQNTP